MAKDRARRRAERQAVLEKEKAARARRVVRRQRRRALIGKLKPPRAGRSGTLHRRTRAERIGITLVPLTLVGVIWLFVPDLGLRIILTTVIVLALPALVVVVLGRRA